MSCRYNCEYSCEECDIHDSAIEFVNGYNKALDDFAEKMNRMLNDTDLRDNGYYIENLVSIAKNELKYKRQL